MQDVRCPHSCICISMHWFLCVCNGKVSLISFACSGAQSHLRNLGSHWSNTTVSFFFSRRTFKIGCQDLSPQHLAERSRKSLHCSGRCQWPIWISLSEQGLFKLFFSSPRVEESVAETWSPESVMSQGQRIEPIMKVTLTSWSMWSREDEDEDNERSLSWDV